MVFGCRTSMKVYYRYMYGLIWTRISVQIFRDEIPVVIVTTSSVGLTKFAKMVAEFF